LRFAYLGASFHKSLGCSGYIMDNTNERRSSRRFVMSLPLSIRSDNGAKEAAKQARTRDVSFRGVFFLSEAAYEPGSRIEFVLTLPKEITQADDVNIRCYGEVLRVESKDEGHGVAARIERYEFLPGPA